MYKCVACGHLFEDGEEKKVVDMHGFSHGAGEEFYVCPSCNGEYVEVEICPICDEWKEKKDFHGGVCNDCIDSKRYDVDICYKIGKHSVDSVELNGFILKMFDDIETIEHVLLEHLKKPEHIDCKEFIEEDADFFGEMLYREVKEK